MGNPKESTFMGFSIINHPFGVPHLWKPLYGFTAFSAPGPHSRYFRPSFADAELFEQLSEHLDDVAVTLADRVGRLPLTSFN